MSGVAADTRKAAPGAASARDAGLAGTDVAGGRPTATPAPANALDKARGLDSAVREQAADQSRRIDEADQVRTGARRLGHNPAVVAHPAFAGHPNRRHRAPCAAMNNDYPHPIIAREGWPFLAHRARRRRRC